MNIEEYRDYCLAKPMTTEDMPFNDSTLVFKVAGKMFALASLKQFVSINLKCDPERALELREQFEQIKPGYHMNKKHWNTVHIEGLTNAMIKDLIDHSYSLVVSKLPKKFQSEIEL